MATFIVIGILAAVIVLQEIRYDRTVERMMLQARIPSPGPTRTAPPRSEPVEPAETRKLLFRTTIPS